MKKYLLALAAVCSLGACVQSNTQAASGPDGYALSCDQLGHLSIVRMYADGTINHSQDISYPVQDCKTLPDGTTILSKPGVKFSVSSQ